MTRDPGSTMATSLETPDGLAPLRVGRLRIEVSGEEIADGVTVGEGTSLASAEELEPPVWIGAGCEVGARARGARSRAALREFSEARWRTHR